MLFVPCLCRFKGRAYHDPSGIDVYRSGNTALHSLTLLVLMLSRLARPSAKPYHDDPAPTTSQDMVELSEG